MENHLKVTRRSRCGTWPPHHRAFSGTSLLSLCLGSQPCFSLTFSRLGTVWYRSKSQLRCAQVLFGSVGGWSLSLRLSVETGGLVKVRRSWPFIWISFVFVVVESVGNIRRVRSCSWYLPFLSGSVWGTSWWIIIDYKFMIGRWKAKLLWNWLRIIWLKFLTEI